MSSDDDDDDDKHNANVIPIYDQKIFNFCGRIKMMFKEIFQITIIFTKFAQYMVKKSELTVNPN